MFWYELCMPQKRLRFTLYPNLVLYLFWGETNIRSRLVLILSSVRKTVICGTVICLNLRSVLVNDVNGLYVVLEVYFKCIYPRC